MVGYILKNSLSVLAKKPVMLWAVSVLSSIIIALVYMTGLFVPIITIPIVLTLSAGMSALYLDGYDGKQINSKQLFRGFTKENVPRVTAGMCWHKLWSIIWAFVPIANIVKSYSYRFTPYILLTRPDVSALDALKLSMKETKGYKLMMFLTDLLIAAVVVAAYVVLALLSRIPHIGVIFAIIIALLYIATALFLPLLYGVVGAAFYREINNGRFTAATYSPASYNPAPQQPYTPQQFYNPSPARPYTPPVNADGPTPKAGDWYCSGCQTLNAAGTRYCRACGKINVPAAPAQPTPAEPPAGQAPGSAGGPEQ